MSDLSLSKGRTERRRATQRPLGRRPLRVLLTIHTGVCPVPIDYGGLERGDAQIRLKTPAPYISCYCVFDAELALSHGRLESINTRVCYTCSANHDFPCQGAQALGAELPAMGSGAHRHALLYPYPSIYSFHSFCRWAAQAHRERLPVGRQARLIAV